MATINEELLEASLFNALRQAGVGEELAAEVAEQIARESYPDIAKAIMELPFNTISEDDPRIVELINAIAAGFAWDKISTGLTAKLREVSIEEAEIAAQQLDEVTPTTMQFNVPLPETLLAAVFTLPANGRDVAQIMASEGATLQQTVFDAFMDGVRGGETIQQIAAGMADGGFTVLTATSMKEAIQGGKVIARTMTNLVQNRSREAMYAENTDIVAAVEYVATLDDRTTFICMSLHGNVYPVGKGERPPQHPQCFIDPKMPIYTVNGWKHIKDIAIGEYVLTHKGRFKRVTELNRTVKATPNAYTINVKNAWGKIVEITITEGHPIMSDRGWIAVENVKSGDVVQMVEHIDEKYPQYIFVDVKSVKANKIDKPITLYNFAVEEDESYIAKGFVVHNCRGATVPVLREDIGGPAPTPKTFDKWLDGQSAGTQNKMLGPVRAEMWRQGRSDIGGFVDDFGNTIPLKDFGLNRAGNILEPTT